MLPLPLLLLLMLLLQQLCECAASLFCSAEALLEAQQNPAAAPKGPSHNSAGRGPPSFVAVLSNLSFLLFLTYSF